MRIRRERSFFGATREEAEALAAPFVASTNGKIFYSAFVLPPPLPEGFRQSPKWQVDVEYLRKADAGRQFVIIDQPSLWHTGRMPDEDPADRIP